MIPGLCISLYLQLSFIFLYITWSRHHRYLGMFQHNCYHGSGIIITSTGTYCEATFANNKIVEHHDSLLMDPNGRSFLGKVGGYIQLVGKVRWSCDVCMMQCDVTIRGSCHYITCLKWLEYLVATGLKGSFRSLMDLLTVMLEWRPSRELIIIRRES